MRFHLFDNTLISFKEFCLSLSHFSHDRCARFLHRSIRLRCVHSDGFFCTGAEHGHRCFLHQCSPYFRFTETALYHCVGGSVLIVCNEYLPKFTEVWCLRFFEGRQMGGGTFLHGDFRYNQIVPVIEKNTSPMFSDISTTPSHLPSAASPSRVENFFVLHMTGRVASYLDFFAHPPFR